MRNALSHPTCSPLLSRNNLHFQSMHLNLNCPQAEKIGGVVKHQTHSCTYEARTTDTSTDLSPDSSSNFVARIEYKFFVHFGTRRARCRPVMCPKYLWPLLGMHILLHAAEGHSQCGGAPFRARGASPPQVKVGGGTFSLDRSSSIDPVWLS